MMNIQLSTCNRNLSHSSAAYLFKRYGEQYSLCLDSPLEVGGVNNFAEGALALQAGHKNESKDWTSSLTKERIKSLPCLKRFKQVSDVCRKTVVPEGKENALLELSDPQPQKQPLTLRTKPNNQAFENSPKDNNFDQQSNNSRDARRGSRFLDRASSNEDVHKTGRQGHQPAGANENRKHLFSGPGNYNAVFSGATPIMPPYKKPEVAKRTFQDATNDNQYDEDESKVTVGAFKTAREKLLIDQQKKFGRNRGGGGGGASTSGSSGGQTASSNYGTSKRSLGARRGLNSKFVPPVINRDDEDSDNGGILVQKALGSAGGSSRKSNNDPQEPVDERLKNIDPKMIELVTNEIMDHGPPMQWSDIAGLEFAKKTIKEIVVWPMLRPDIFTGLRGPPKGLLLFGPPGTGKTLIGKCIACQSKSTFFSISASSLTSKWVGEGEKMVRALFAVSRVHQPAVIFIDEIDSLLSQRTDGEHEASRRIKTEFLVQLDGATTSSEDRILVVGATNRPQEIDEAARRRFVKRLYIPLPETEARSQIIYNLMAQQAHQLSPEQVLKICQSTQGYSGADMANLCREAALGPIRCMSLDDIENITADQVRPIAVCDFEKALLQVRASVSEKDLDVYLDWNKQYGSWEL